MPLFRNLLIVGALALVIPIDGNSLAGSAEAVVSGATTAVGLATTVVSDTAGFCERNKDVCREVAEDVRTVATRTVSTVRGEAVTADGARVIDRPDARTTILVRS